MKFSALSDPCLVQLLRASDNQAFGILYGMYWDKLYSIALNRLQDSFDAEEVVQDIYTRLWKNREKLVVETEFDRYLSGAVKLEVINRLSKSARVLAYAGKVRQSMCIMDDRDIHQCIDMRRLLNDVDQTIETLPKKCRTVFNLSRKRHLSHKTIAEQLQISEKTVQKHITSALKTLREKYASLL